MALKIRILIADDHAVVRQGIRTMLEPKQDFEVVGEALNGKEVVEKCLQLQPDLVILDLLMPIMDGIQAIKEMKKEKSKTKILVLTSYPEEEKVIAALKAGATGYILKNSSPSELIQAIWATHQGKMWMPPDLAPKVLEKLVHPDQHSSEEIPLTKRELDVLKLVAKGISNNEIASTLCIDEGTVRFHMNNILSKLGLENRTQVAIYALKKGIVPFD